jgi:hypothetical protein
MDRSVVNIKCSALLPIECALVSCVAIPVRVSVTAPPHCLPLDDLLRKELVNQFQVVRLESHVSSMSPYTSHSQG